MPATLRMVETRHGPAQRPDAIVEFTIEAFRDLTAGRQTFGEAIDDGTAATSGDRDALDRLGALFPRPPRQALTPAG